ncbi:hypothetical protein [Conchiformibius steedae]|uniref:hypothetical protein n=1 Tax=Conchiformibius steedae TaxID=153493 RepID=UPI0026F293A5|nr:hypothetical protein [Conchiformibius steedae]
MKKLLVSAAVVLSLSACGSTWSGMKDDASRNMDKTEAAVEKGWDKTKETGEKVADKTEEVLKKGAEKVGKGVRKTGEAIERMGQ